MKKLVAAALVLAGCSSPPPPAEPAIDLVVGKSPSSAPLEVEPDRPVETPSETADGKALPGRDPRRLSQAPRAAPQIEAEVTGLERLLATTAKNAPDRPPLLRRVAEAYVELARARTAEGVDGAGASQAAIARYKTLIDDHPQYAQLDEALYFQAFEHERLGDLKQARAAYYDVIRKVPSSKYIAYAYFAFGELFFREAASDPSKNDLAAQAFQEALKYPPPNNGVFPDTLLRLVQTYDRKGDRAKADAFARRLERDHANTTAAIELRNRASHP